MAELIRRQQLVEQVIERLYASISTGEYAVGAKLPAEPGLMEELGVGRSTLREAVSVLAHGGVLEVRQGDGTYVRALPESAETLERRLGRARLMEVQEVRRVLETAVVRLAAIRRTEPDLALIRGHLDARRDAAARGDMASALAADTAFHTSIAESAGNEVLAELYRAFARTLSEALKGQWETGKAGPSETEALHDRLLCAIAGHDADSAASITNELLDRHEPEREPFPS